MNTATVYPKNNRGLRVLLGVIALLLVVGAFTGLNPAAGLSDRTSLIALFLVGMTMCPLAMRLDAYGWRNPFNLVGSALGAFALLLIGAYLFGAQLSWISTDHAAIVSLAGVMAVKITLAGIRNFVAKSARMKLGAR